MEETRTLGQLLTDAAVRYPEKTYIECGDASLSFAEVHERANGAARDLIDLGVTSGDRVCLLVPNQPEFLFVLFGAARLGASVVSMDPAATPPELAGMLRRADPTLFVVDRALVARAEDAVATASLEVSLVVIEEVGIRRDAEPFVERADADDVAVMLPTSGTTAASKLVMQSHRTLVLAAEAFPWWLGLTPDDRLMTSLPLFHINALAYSALGALSLGAPLVLLPGFSARDFLDRARAHEATQFNAVGAMLEILMRQPARGSDRVPSLRLCYVTPAPATRERHLEIEERFGFRISAGYGLSETPFGTIWPPTGPPMHGAMGTLKQHPRLGKINSARVVNDEGNTLAAGSTGELLLSNPALMTGYFRMPEETAAVLKDGWLRTGDLVQVDGDGAFRFFGRKKDLIRRRGENIAPIEIEEALHAHPRVTQAAVVGVPADLGDEDVKAFVVMEDPDPMALAEWLDDKLAPHKIPRYFEFVEALPTTATGRPIKRHLSRAASGAQPTQR
jgi:crotonobetaine/carnitine-CoA ligase